MHSASFNSDVRGGIADMTKDAWRGQRTYSKEGNALDGFVFTIPDKTTLICGCYGVLICACKPIF